MNTIDRSRIDSGQFPEWAEFEEDTEFLTEVRPRAGFYMGLGSGGKTWRFRVDGTTVHVEYWNGSAWEEKGQFIA